ncbi:MAG: hypothetical protein U0X87_16545 [Anaerolineales bacterium]
MKRKRTNELPKKLVNKGWELGFVASVHPRILWADSARERSAVVTGVLAIEEMAFGDMAGTLAVMTPSLLARR